ncbi:hypothetical protein F4776DRAFT_662425 [Hypoxylon sp. NC0597]|nr:hypothetical protein F4776DRAFT_662425 [Hypoxylon sp. NC0597]
MAIVEVVFPQLKKDPEIIKEAATKVPIIIKAFKDAGVLRVLQGFVGSEDGKDISSEFKEVLVLEWPNESAFRDFVKSPGYADAMGALKPFVTGPSELNLFEANDGAHLLGGGPVLELLLVSPKSASSDEDAKSILKKIQSSLEKANVSKAVYGSTLNLPEKKIGILRGFESKSDLESEKNAASRKEIIAEIGSVADVTQLVADVQQIPL